MSHLSGRPLLDTTPDAALYVGRPGADTRARQAVDDGLNCLVVGDRGSGRTTFLRRLAHDLRDRGVTVAVVDAATATDAAELLHLVAARTTGAGSRAGQPPDPAVPGAGERTRAALHVLSAAADRLPSVLLLDSVPPAAAHSVFGRLRDELWQLPVTWVVTCAERDRATFLRPPADAFFDVVVTLDPLDDEAARDLVRRRAGPDVLPDAAVQLAVDMARGNPRALVASARALAGSSGLDEVAAEHARRQQVVAALGAPARMLLAELEASGPASASDATLLARLGWTRGRAAQVLGELERAGLVRASAEPSGPGRPRKVFAPVPLGERPAP